MTPGTAPAAGTPLGEGAAEAPATGAFGYPVFLDLRGRHVVVAGGGREPAHKIPTLLGLGARVTAWAPEHRETAPLDGSPGLRLTGGAWDPVVLDDAIIAIVATGDRATDRAIATDARARKVLVNTVDDIPFCDWSAPAILRRGDLTVAVGTGGIAPALAVRIRDRAARDVGPEYGRLLAIFGAVRPRIMATGRSFGDRRRLWYGLADGPALGLLRGGDDDAARRAVDDAITDWEAEG